MVQERAEGPKAPSPGQRPGYNGNKQGALLGQKLYILPGVFKAFALTGRVFKIYIIFRHVFCIEIQVKLHELSVLQIQKCDVL